MENIIVLPIMKRMEIVMSIQDSLILGVNINYKENGGKTSFSCESKHQYRVSQRDEHDWRVNNKKNGDY